MNWFMRCLCQFDSERNARSPSLRGGRPIALMGVNFAKVQGIAGVICPRLDLHLATETHLALDRLCGRKVLCKSSGASRRAGRGRASCRDSTLVRSVMHSIQLLTFVIPNAI